MKKQQMETKGLVIVEEKEHKKMYKKGKHWVIAPIAFLGLVGTAGLATQDTFAAELDKPVVSDTQKDTSSQPTKVQEEVLPGNESAVKTNDSIENDTTNSTENVVTPIEDTSQVEQASTDTNVTPDEETPAVTPDSGQTNTDQATPTNNTEAEKDQQDPVTPETDTNTADEQNNEEQAKKDEVKEADAKENTPEEKTKAEVDKKAKDTATAEAAEAQKNVDQQAKEAKANAEKNGVVINEGKEKTYDDQAKAQADLDNQMKALNDATKAMNEANKRIEDAINKAKAAGTTVVLDGTVQTTAEKAMKEAEAIIKQIQAIASENEEIQKRNQAALDAYNKAKAALDAKNAQIKKENEAIAARNKQREDAYNKLIDEYLNGTKVSTNVEARTQSYNDQEQYRTFMEAEVNQETGEFTLTHDMNDGVSIIGRGVLKGKINWKIVSNGDGSETITISSIDLYSYVYTNLHPNTGANQNINFHVYDINGNEIFAVYHDGNSTFTKNINKNVKYNNVSFKLKAGEKSVLKELLKVDDNWIYNTHGQILVQFKNLNEKPKKPDYEQEKPLDPTQLTPPTPEKLKEAKAKKIVVVAEAHPVKVAEKQKQVPVTPMKNETPKTPQASQAQPVQNLTVEKASIAPSLPHTGEKENTLLSVLGAGMLACLAWFGFKRKKVEK